MPVQWRNADPSSKRLPFLNCPPKAIILLLQRPNEFRGLLLHFPAGRRDSVLCMGDDCEHCADCPQKEHFYTVALLYDLVISEWRRVIVDVGHRGGRLCNDNFAGESIIVDRRRKDGHWGELEYVGPAPVSRLKAPPLAHAEDVRPFLMRRYGQYAEADYFAALPTLEQGRLRFPGHDSGKEVG